MPDDPGRSQAAERVGTAVAITAEALSVIEDHVRAGGVETETGGILLGHETPTGCHVVIAGGPGPQAVRTPTSFNRDLAHAEGLAEEAWLKQRAVWVGEWHTHVNVDPVPSETDLSSYLRHLDDADLGFDRFISIIVGPVGVPEPAALSRSGDISTSPFQRAVRRPTAILTWIVEGRTVTAVPLYL